MNHSPDKRRWHQFSLRTLLIFVTVLAVGPGSWVIYERTKAQRQKAAVSLLGKQHSEVHSRLSWMQALLVEDAPGNVVGVSLRNRQVSDADLAPLADLPDLIWLDLDGTPLSDQGLVHLAGLKKLRRLRLDETQITDAGLANVANLTQLETLNLYKTGVTDAGLVHLAGLTNLETLILQKTQVTEAGVAKLQQALPKLHIER